MLPDHPEGADEGTDCLSSSKKHRADYRSELLGWYWIWKPTVQAEDLAKDIRFVSGSPQQDLEVNIEFDVLGEGKPKFAWWVG